MDLHPPRTAPVPKPTRSEPNPRSPAEPPSGTCGGILADYMGLGKTVMALSLVAATLEEQESPTLVVCPSTLVQQWKREAARWLPGVDCVVVTSTRTLASQLDGHRGLALAAYSTLRRINVAGAQLHRVVFDEAHTMGSARPPSPSTPATHTATVKVGSGPPGPVAPFPRLLVCRLCHPVLFPAGVRLHRRTPPLGADRHARHHPALRPLHADGAACRHVQRLGVQPQHGSVYSRQRQLLRRAAGGVHAAPYRGGAGCSAGHRRGAPPGPAGAAVGGGAARVHRRQVAGQHGARAGHRHGTAPSGRRCQRG